MKVKIGDGHSSIERKTYMESNKVNHINPLKSLVDNGTITQDQAEKIGLGGHGAENYNGADRHMKGQNGK